MPGLGVSKRAMRLSKSLPAVPPFAGPKHGSRSFKGRLTANLPHFPHHVHPRFHKRLCEGWNSMALSLEAAICNPNSERRGGWPSGSGAASRGGKVLQGAPVCPTALLELADGHSSPAASSKAIFPSSPPGDGACSIGSCCGCSLSTTGESSGESKPPPNPKTSCSSASSTSAGEGWQPASESGLLLNGWRASGCDDNCTSAAGKSGRDEAPPAQGCLSIQAFAPLVLQRPKHTRHLRPRPTANSL